MEISESILKSNEVVIINTGELGLGKVSISKEYIETIDNSLEIDYLELENSKEMKVIEELMEYKRSGNISKFYQTADEVIYNFKEEFRLENA